MSTARVLTRNIFSNWAGLAVNVGIGFFMMPFLVSRLGDTLYGIWMLVASLVGYGSLLDFGVRSSIVKYVSQHHAIGDQEALHRLFATTLAIYAAIGMIVLALTTGVALFLSDLFRIPSELVDDAQFVLVIVGFNLALKFPIGVFEGFVTGLQRYEIANAISIGGSLLRAGITVILLLQGYKLLALATVGLLGDILMGGVMVSACIWLLPWLSIRKRYLSRKVFREVYAFGMWSSLIAMASRVLYDSDSILIGILLPAAAITHFAVANNLVRYLRQLALGFGNVFTPAASDLNARSERERLANLVIHGTRYAMSIILPAAIFVAVIGQEFLALWIGPRYAVESSAVLITLALSQAASMALFPAGAMLYGLNRHQYLAYILLVQAIFKVSLTTILLPSYGVLGAAIGTAIPELVASIVVVPLLIVRCVGLSIRRYFHEAFLPPIACVMPAALVMFALKMVIAPESWMLLIVEIMVGLSLYGVLAIRFCLDRPQRQMVFGLLGGVMKRVTV